MSAFKRAVTVELDADDVENLLVTAFDGAHGGCWYWVNEEVDEINHVQIKVSMGKWTRAHFKVEAADRSLPWRDETLYSVDHGNEATYVVSKQSLEWAVAQVMARFDHTETARQIKQWMASGDMDIDAEGADVLVQIALFNDIVFG